MDDQKQISEQDFLANQQFESLARQNAQQAVRIAQLEAQLALIQARAQQPAPPQEASTQEVSDEDYEEPVADPTH